MDTFAVTYRTAPGRHQLQVHVSACVSEGCLTPGFSAGSAVVVRPRMGGSVPARRRRVAGYCSVRLPRHLKHVPHVLLEDLSGRCLFLPPSPTGQPAVGRQQRQHLCATCRARGADLDRRRFELPTRGDVQDGRRDDGRSRLLAARGRGGRTVVATPDARPTGALSDGSAATARIGHRCAQIALYGVRS